MQFLELIVLAVVQGLTEFLPISSSAHLILVPILTGWQDQGLAFDLAVHLGTLVAVVGYFRRDLLAMTHGFWHHGLQEPRYWFGFRQTLPYSDAIFHGRLTWFVILATLPAVIFGVLIKEAVETVLRGPLIIAATTIVFGLLLGLSTRWGTQSQSITRISLAQALMIGMAQAIALIPGTSRSGITLTAGLFLGLDKTSAARFSFLLSIPITAAAILLKTKDLLESPLPVPWIELGTAALLAAVSAYVAIHFFLQLLNRLSLDIFVVYRLILGTVLLVIFWP